METVRNFIFLGSKITTDGDYSHELKDASSLEEKLWETSMHIKKQKHYLADQGASSQSYGFSSSNVWMWELDHKESWALKNWCFWTAVLEKTLESPLDCKEIKPAPQFKSINSLVLSFLYGPTLTSVHDYWKNYSFD